MDAKALEQAEKLMDEVRTRWPEVVRLSQSQRPPALREHMPFQALSSVYRVPFHEVERRLDEIILLGTDEHPELRTTVDPNRKVAFQRINAKMKRARAIMRAHAKGK